MDDWFMGLAPENLLAENNLVKMVTLIRWNWEGRCSASSITGCWFSRWCCLPSQVMVGLTLLGGNESSIWNVIYIQFVWCDYLCWQEPRTCASPRIQAGRQRILSEASGFELMLFETNFPVPCYVSEPPLALAVTVFSRGLSVLTAGPAGCPKARSSSRQYPDPTEGSLLSTPYVNGSFHRPWCSSPSIFLLLLCNEYSSGVDQVKKALSCGTSGFLRMIKFMLPKIYFF